MTKQNDSISKRHNTNLWAEIKKLYESKTAPNYQRIKAILSAEFNLEKFPSEATMHRHAKNENWKRYVPEDSIKTFNNTYTPEFWLCVRAVYESNPKITYKRLRELVQNELQCDDFPSADAINTKAKHEDWARLGELRSKNESDLKKLKTSVKNLDIVVHSDGKNKTYKSDDYQEDEDEIDPVDLLDFDRFAEVVDLQKRRIEKVLMSSKSKQLKMAEVITKARRRLATINDIGDLLNDQLMTNYALLTAPEVMEMDGAVEYVERQGKVLQKTIVLYNELTFGRRESIKLEMQMYGVGLEDLRVVDQDTRMKDLNDDKAFEAQKQRLLEQRELIAKRNHYINSGGLERDVQEEAQRRMAEAGMDDEDGVFDDEYEGLEG